jgi:uroporphyrinogen decarboxylase
MIWMHNSEISVPHVQSHIPLGCSFESIGPDADITAMRAATKNKQAISGNLDPIKILMNGSPELVASEVERIIGICKDGGHYIFAPGEMNPRQVPEENMRTMMSTAKKLSRY